MKILKNRSPEFLQKQFTISERSNRLIYPKFKYESLKKKCFTFNCSKILNYFYDHDIPYFGIISDSVFKSRLKHHLLAIQGQSRTGDDEWLPSNHNIFSDVRLGFFDG